MWLSYEIEGHLLPKQTTANVGIRCVARTDHFGLTAQAYGGK
jgi:hypothetical protein